MKVTQLSIFAENKPGHILAPCRLLAESGVDIRALSVADTQSFGILRLIVSGWEAAASLLEEAGFLVRATEEAADGRRQAPFGFAQDEPPLRRKETREQRGARLREPKSESSA